MLSTTPEPSPANTIQESRQTLKKTKPEKNMIQKKEPKNNSLKPNRPSVPAQQINHTKPRPIKQTPIKPLAEPSSIQSNPQLLSQVLTMLRAEIIQEIRELHLDHFKKLSKRMSNMENLLGSPNS